MQAPEGTLISFATQPGNVALDGVEDSPYSKALAEAMRRPGLDVFRTFNEVGLAVASATGGEQQPWLALSPIKGDFYFAGPAAQSQTASAPAPAQQEEEAHLTTTVTAAQSPTKIAPRPGRDLTWYADAKGNLDVQVLTCAQLDNTHQEDADFMTVWYTGWYNGLAGFSKLKVDRAIELEHRIIAYCKSNPDTKVITATDIQIKSMRKEQGIGVGDEK
jgi:hypothetical protein